MRSVAAEADERSSYVTPRRARVLRAMVEAERQDAIRAGERPPSLVCARGGPATEYDREAIAQFAAELAARAASSSAGAHPPALTEPAAHGPVGAPVVAGGRPCRFCDQPAIDRFLTGHLCADHAPTVPIPDPSRTARALYERRMRHLRALAKARP